MAYQLGLVDSGIAALIKDGNCRCCLIGDSTVATQAQTTYPNGIVDEWKVNWKGLWCLADGTGWVAGTTNNFAPSGYSAAAEVNQAVGFYSKSSLISTQSGLTVTSGLLDTVPSLCDFNVLPKAWTQFDFTGNANTGNTSAILSYIGRFGSPFDGVPGYYNGDWTDGDIKIGVVFGVPNSGAFPAAGVLAFNTQKPVSTVFGGTTYLSASYSGLTPGDVLVLEVTRTAAQVPAATLPGVDQRYRSDILEQQKQTFTSCAYAHALAINTYVGDTTTDETGKKFVTYGHYIERTDMATGFVLDSITMGGKSIANFFVDKGDDGTNGLFHDESMRNQAAHFQANLYILAFAVNPSHSPYTEWANGGVVYAGKYRENLEALIARIDAAHTAESVALPKYLILTPNRNPEDETNRPITTYQQWSDEAFALVRANLSRMAVIDRAMWTWNNFTNAELCAIQPATTTQGTFTPGGVHPNKNGSRAWARFDWAQIESAYAESGGMTSYAHS